jgi:hypothetical protein
MPLSESEAGILIWANLSPSGGWGGEPDIVIRCSWCGCLVRTHHADRCSCGRLRVRKVEGLVKTNRLGAADSEVYRLASRPRAG